MTVCDYVDTKLDAYLSGGLSPTEELAFEKHLGNCEICQRQAAIFRRLQEQVENTIGQWRPATHLVQRVESALSQSRQSRRPTVFKWGRAVAAGIVLLALTATVFFAHHGDSDQFGVTLASEFNTFVISGRTLDYRSSDPQAVRAWFRDKVSFRPPFPETSSGLTLAGGRLCNIADKRVASYMYRAGDAWVSLYIMKSDGEVGPAETSVDGYTMLDWVSEDLRFVLIGDVPAEDLGRLAQSIGGASLPLS